MFTSEIWKYLSIHLVLNEFNVKTIRLMQYDVIDIANFYSFFLGRNDGRMRLPFRILSICITSIK